MSASLSMMRPGLRAGPWPERRIAADGSDGRPCGTGGIDTALPVRLGADRDTFDNAVLRLFKRPIERELRDLRRFRKRLRAIDEAEQRIQSLDIVALNCEVQRLRVSLSGTHHAQADLVDAFALVRLAVRQCLGFRLHDEQLYAGWCLLAGHFVEMQTGEGKTLTAAMPAVIMALSGVPVHVISANDYLVKRDSQTLAPIYRWFGLSTGLVLAEQDDVEKRRGYAADICYCTHQQVVFDYLRDNRLLHNRRHGLSSRLRELWQEAPEPLLQRGLCFAIVDEADSVLIDDARTPLILSEQRSDEGLSMSEAAVALAIARDLVHTQHYLLKPDLKQARLTEAGVSRIRERTASLPGSWQFERYRQERISQALVALHLYQADVDYLVQQDRVDLIDTASGRPTPQRRLQHGVHRLIEVKERCSISDETTPVASLSYQRFFPRYHRLCGMSGTLREVRRELQLLYGVRVIEIPTVRASRRRVLPLRLLSDRQQQFSALCKAVAAVREQGRAVLIGTRSVAMSEQVGRALEAAHIPHTILNARQDAAEAGIIAAAGRRGQVTVATNMAGRGTDIALDADVAEAGGLHVISLEVNDSQRLDRQLQGRAARQGQAGSCQEMLCLDDTLLDGETNRISRPVMSYLLSVSRTLPSAVGRLWVRHAQRRVEHRDQQRRLRVARGQTRLQRVLSVGGARE